MINKLKDEFLKSHRGYENDIKNFVDYLNNLYPPSPFNSKFTIRGMSVDVILQCLKYYVENKIIKKKEPARKFLVVIGQLMEYLYEADSELVNETLRKQLGAPANRADSYKRKCNDFIELLDLEEKETLAALSPEAVNVLNNKCNEAIEKYIKLDMFERISFKNAVSALCIKLILCTGITYNVTRTIKISDFDVNSGVLSINGYKVSLPLNLLSQMKRYVSRIKYQEFENIPEFLFFGIDGNQWGKTTTSSGMPNFLMNQLQQDDIDDELNSGLTHLVKYGITQLILQGVNDSVISDLTGASHGIIETCHKPNQEEEWFSYLNSKLIKTEFFKLDCSNYFETQKTLNN